MICSVEFLLTVCMIALCVLTVFALEQQPAGRRVVVRPTLRANWQRWSRRPVFWWIMVPFFLVLLTAPYSSDFAQTVERLRIKLPFLVLPFALLSIPSFSRRDLQRMAYALLGIMSLVAIGVSIHYFLNLEAITAAVERGKAVPVPSNHIRFSLTVALSVLTGLCLLLRSGHFRTSREQGLTLVATLFLFVFAHLLAVRSGLVTLYVGAFLLLSGYIVRSRRWGLGLLLLTGTLATPYLAYRTVPSLQKKIDYALWDRSQYQQGTGQNYSDSERLVSLSIGWKVAQQHWLFGTGAGDLKQSIRSAYAAQPDLPYSFRMPHNQFLIVLAGTGIFGLLLFLAMLVVLAVGDRRYRVLPWLVFFVVIVLSFLVENTFENNFGISLYLLFLLVGLNYLEVVSCSSTTRTPA